MGAGAPIGREYGPGRPRGPVGGEQFAVIRLVRGSYGLGVRNYAGLCRFLTVSFVVPSNGPGFRAPPIATTPYTTPINMLYALLIYSDEAQEPTPQDPSFGAHIEAYMNLSGDMEKAGIKPIGQALKGVSTATSVRTKGSSMLVTDGPFAETKETLGGFYPIDVEDLDAALEWAKRIPSVAFGTVEVRPIETFGQ
ncbi:MAG: hypothetical protein ACI9HE_001811 [Planctomycetota bacterium]|jgi:hypothetical protein